MTFDDLLSEVKRIASGKDETEAKLLALTALLHDNAPHYDWVGFYFVNPERADELVLGPYTGEPTEHTHIPFGRGICGRVALTQETLVIQDVAAERNYLSCSPFVKSEIVLPIFVDGKFAGELDIDSHAHAPFTDADEEFLGEVCRIVAYLFKLHTFD